MCDRKHMFGDKSTYIYLVQARMVKTCPKKVNKKKYFFVHYTRVNYPSFNVKKNCFFLLTFLTCFGHSSLNQIYVGRLVTKHVLSITHFHSYFFLTFPFKLYLYKKIKFSIKDYLLLIYTFSFMIIFPRIIILSFQSHQTRILSAGLRMAWNRSGLSRNITRNFIIGSRIVFRKLYSTLNSKRFRNRKMFN